MEQFIVGNAIYKTYYRDDTKITYINRVAARDQTEYHWARTTGPMSWKVLLHRQHVADLDGYTESEIADVLKRLDDAAGLKPCLVTW